MATAVEVAANHEDIANTRIVLRVGQPGDPEERGGVSNDRRALVDLSRPNRRRC